MKEQETFRKVQQLIQDSNHIVFFGGAGVSTASGIPDFRSKNGIYSQYRDGPYPAEYYFSHEFFENDPAGFSDFSRQCFRSYQRVAPSGCHLALAELEKEGRIRAVVTQNIDGLHQRAGSHKVLEVHGSMNRFFCSRCGRPADPEAFMEGEGIYHCPHCGGIVRPQVVLYGEALDSAVFMEAIRCIAQADVLIVGGSSLVVYPAAGLIDYYRGHKLILINYDPTPADSRADYVLQGNIAQLMPALIRKEGGEEVEGEI